MIFRCFLRTRFASLAMAPVIVKDRDSLRHLSGVDLIRLVLLAVIGVFLFNVFLFFGLRHISAGTTGVITSLSPLVLAALAFVLLNEQVTLTKLVAVFVAVCGIAVVNLQAAGRHTFSWFGFVLICGVVLCEAAFTLFAKSVSARVAPRVMGLVVVWVSTVLFLPFGAWQLVTAAHLSLSVKEWLLLAYLGVVVNAIAYLLWYAGLKTATAAQAGVFTGIIPVSAIVLSYVFLREPVTLLDGLGLGLVLCGVVLVTA